MASTSTSTTGRASSAMHVETSATQLPNGLSTETHLHSPSIPNEPDRTSASNDTAVSTSRPRARKSSSKTHNYPAALSSGMSDEQELQLEGMPAYRLNRVQKIAKMENEHLKISKEAVLVIALAAEQVTRTLARAGQEAREEAQRVDMTVPDLANAVASSSNLSFLSEIIPQTVSLRKAREARISKDVTSAPPDATQQMISHVQEQLRYTTRGHMSANSHHQKNVATTTAGNPVGIGAPVSSVMSGVLPSPRTYSAREARAVANAAGTKKSTSTGARPLAPTASQSGPVPFPVGVSPGSIQTVNVGGVSMPVNVPMVFPPGFDFRNMPPPPPGMAYAPVQITPGMEAEMFRGGIRWAPVQANNGSASPSSTGKNPEGVALPPMSFAPSGQNAPNQGTPQHVWPMQYMMQPVSPNGPQGQAHPPSSNPTQSTSPGAGGTFGVLKPSKQGGGKKSSKASEGTTTTNPPTSTVSPTASTSQSTVSKTNTKTNASTESLSEPTLAPVQTSSASALSTGMAQEDSLPNSHLSAAADARPGLNGSAEPASLPVTSTKKGRRGTAKRRSGGIEGE